jgi:DNA-binding HxlR family transcriptional regulator
VDVSLTADQKRQHNQAAYNAALEGCPARQLLETISSKWVTLVLLELAEGTRRHSELRRRIPGASQKMLTSTLRTLERDGLVLRHVTPSVPVRTDYELSQLGRSLLGVVYGLKDWAEESMPAVEFARLAHDQTGLESAGVSPHAQHTASPLVTA